MDFEDPNAAVLPASSRESLEWFRNVFAKAFDQGQMTKKALSRMVEKDNAFYEQLFVLLDIDESGEVSLHEFAGGMHRLGRGRDIPDRKVADLTYCYLKHAGTHGNLGQREFVAMSKESKFGESIFGLFDRDDSGKVDYTEFMMGLDKLARSSTDIKWYTWAEKWFSKNSSPEGRITKTQFLEYLNVSKSVFGERLFAAVDTDSSGEVDVTELMQVMHILSQGSSKERLMLLFTVYDLDGDGVLSYPELKTILEWSLIDSSFKIKTELLDKLTNVLFKNIDADENGSVSLVEFERFINRFPQLAESITISLSACLRPKERKKRWSSAAIRETFGREISYIKNNKPLIGYWFIYTSINVIMFMTAAAKYWGDNNIFVVLARGPGSCLNFNSAFIVVLMFRHILTYLRSTPAGNYLPLDHSITAHKVTGVVIVAFSLLHAAMHVANFGESPDFRFVCTVHGLLHLFLLTEVLSRQTNVTWAEYLFTPQDGLGWVGGSACITGWVLVVVLAAIAVTSLPCLRRRGYFQLFYWSHWLFIGWWVTLVIHAPHFWKWLVGPATIYVLEKLWRHTRGRSRSVATIRSIRSVDDKVSEVIIDRPRGLKFNAGDYIFVNISDIAEFEWHPFTVSSAPEEVKFLSLHIQAVGDWTKRLRALGKQNTNPLFKKFKSSISRSKSTSLPFTPPDTKRSLRLSSFDNVTFVHENSSTTSYLGSRQPMGNRALSLPGYPANREDSSPSVVLVKNQLNGQRMLEDVELSNSNIPKARKILIDGPYGSPSTTVYDVDHAIMIAAGIGVTPFASILQSIMFRQKRKRAICPKCNHRWKLDQADGVILVPKKVDFIWVTRTFSALEWFLGVLSELEEEQALVDEEERFMSLSLHVTSALAQSDIRAVALQMAMELCYEEELRDPLCGLRTRIQPGRPNWRKVLQNTLKKTEGKVCVFYCGPPQLEKILHKICQEFNLDFRSENF